MTRRRRRKRRTNRGSIRIGTRKSTRRRSNNWQRNPNYMALLSSPKRRRCATRKQRTILSRSFVPIFRLRLVRKRFSNTSTPSYLPLTQTLQCLRRSRMWNSTVRKPSQYSQWPRVGSRISSDLIPSSTSCKGQPPSKWSSQNSSSRNAT